MDWVLDWKVNFRGVLRSFSVISHGSWGQCVITQFAFCALNFRANFRRVTKRLKSPIQVQHRECRNSTAATSYQATRIITLSFLLLTISAKKWEFKGFITASHKIQEKRGEKMKKKKNELPSTVNSFRKLVLLSKNPTCSVHRTEPVLGAKWSNSVTHSSAALL